MSEFRIDFGLFCLISGLNFEIMFDWNQNCIICIEICKFISKFVGFISKFVEFFDN